MVLGIAAASLCDVKERSATQEDKSPCRNNGPGFLLGSSETSADLPGPCHICSIITWPKPEHETWVAPCIRRAKS